ncbi:MAG: amidohydrolase family protein [Nitrospinota bacterium]
MLSRRNFLKYSGLGVLGLAGCKRIPDEGILNPCLPPKDLPKDLIQHELLQAAWEGIDPTRFRDMHVHVAGVGHGNSGVAINPAMTSIFHPLQYAQMKFFLNAGCVENKEGVDKAFVQRLFELTKHFKTGAKFMLLAFDHTYSEEGEKDYSKTAIYIPNAYAKAIAGAHPGRFEWIASIHPYRKDCVETLLWASKNGAKAIKWLPPAMGIDPSSPLCDPFYETAAKLNLPLLTHGGKERALHGAAVEAYGNPLLLKRALQHGVRVIVAHCASMGKSIDFDKGKTGPHEESFTLFARLMDDQRFEGLLSGDISAVTQSNRVDVALKDIIEKDHWHHRLFNGSDYPIPGVMPLFSLKLLIERKFISLAEGKVLSEVRKYNPLLFDFVLKRTLTVDGKKLLSGIFEGRKFFSRS